VDIVPVRIVINAVLGLLRWGILGFGIKVSGDRENWVGTRVVLRYLAV
jgi:hypothetical protein